MESLRKYLTNKNLYIANIVSGGLMILMALICYSSVDEFIQQWIFMVGLCISLIEFFKWFELCLHIVLH